MVHYSNHTLPPANENNDETMINKTYMNRGHNVVILVKKQPKIQLQLEIGF